MPHEQPTPRWRYSIKYVSDTACNAPDSYGLQAANGIGYKAPQYLQNQRRDGGDSEKQADLFGVGA